MSLDQSQAVPFVSLSGCLREDYFHRMMRQTLDFAATSSAPCRAALLKVLAPIPVAGFRQFLRAPRSLQVRAAISRFDSSDAFVGRVLEAWLEAHSTLVALGESFLDAQGIPRRRIVAEEEEFHGRWSMDEVLRLADLFCAKHPADRDDVALLLCCLTSRAPVADAPAATDAPAAEGPATTEPVAAQPAEDAAAGASRDRSGSKGRSAGGARRAETRTRKPRSE